jgi:hypothetical protein
LVTALFGPGLGPTPGQDNGAGDDNNNDDNDQDNDNSGHGRETYIALRVSTVDATNPAA